MKNMIALFVYLKLIGLGFVMAQSRIDQAEDLLGSRLDIRTHDLVMIPELDRELELTDNQMEQCCEALELLFFGSNSSVTLKEHDPVQVFKMDLNVFEPILLPHQIERCRQLRLQSAFRVGYDLGFGLLESDLTEMLSLKESQIEGIRQEIFQIEKEYGRVIFKLFDNSSAVLKEAFKEQLLNLLPAQKNKIETTFGSPYIAPDHLQLLFQMSTMANEAGRRRHLRLNSDIESVDFGVLEDQRLKREYGSLFFFVRPRQRAGIDRRPSDRSESKCQRVDQAGKANSSGNVAKYPFGASDRSIGSDTQSIGSGIRRVGIHFRSNWREGIPGIE